MNSSYRKWKHLLGLPLIALSTLFMKGEPEFSPKWYLGLGIALVLGAAYLLEEIYWMAKRQGRPCGQCGKKIQMKSFSVHANCPHCGLELE